MSRFYVTPMFALTLLLLLFSAMATLGSDPEVPPSATVLTDDNFDAHVFSPRSPPRAWLILFYAPWCAHCRSILPIFFNVSRVLDAHSVPHARFGVVNAVEHEALSSRFAVREYPMFVYTTGKPGRWSAYGGGHDARSFAQFAAALQRGAATGSFAEVVSDPRVFAAIEREAANRRVPMYVYVPPAEDKEKEKEKDKDKDGEDDGERFARRRAESREALWNAAVDGAASLGNIRFGVLFADDVARHAALARSESYDAVVRAAELCVRSGKARGPRGEAFVVHSDAYAEPHCYDGVWLDEKNEIDANFAAFIARSGFSAVEEVSLALLQTASTRDHWYVAIFITSGVDKEGDEAAVSVLRELARERNARERDAESRRITLAHANLRMQRKWEVRYGVNEAELPALIVVDPRRDKVFRMRTHTPEFETVKAEMPWRVGGEQQRMIGQFFDDVEAGRAKGEKMTLFGVFADYLVLLPGMEFVYSALGYQDALLVTLVAGVSFAAFVLILAVCVEPAMERRMEAEEKRKKTD